MTSRAVFLVEFVISNVRDCLQIHTHWYHYERKYVDRLISETFVSAIFLNSLHMVNAVNGDFRAIYLDYSANTDLYHFYTLWGL